MDYNDLKKRADALAERQTLALVKHGTPNMATELGLYRLVREQPVADAQESMLARTALMLSSVCGLVTAKSLANGPAGINFFKKKGVVEQFKDVSALLAEGAAILSEFAKLAEEGNKPAEPELPIEAAASQ